MIFYSEIEVADVCFPFEIAEWLALGRVPQFIFDGEGGEARQSLRADANGFCPSADVVPSKSEFQGLEIDIDFEEYIQVCFEDPGFSSIAEAERAIAANCELLERLNIKSSVPPISLKSELTKDEREAIARAETANALLRHILEISRAEVISAMVDGRLPLRGFRYPAEYMEEDIDDDASVFEIPADRFRIDAFNWDANTLRIREGLFLMVQTDVSRMLEVFPSPRIKLDTRSVKVFGSSIISDAKTGNQSRNKRRPPPEGKLRLGKIISAEFERRKRAGELSDKKEAVYAEAMEWSAQVLGQTSSRASIQRYLAKIYD